MKKILLPFSLMTAFIVLSTGTLSAQSDKEIIKAADKDINDKNYYLAFEKIITVSQPEKKKAQEVLKKVYPNLIADYLSKATAVKINDKDSVMVKCEKLGQVIGFLKEGMVTDSLFKKMAQPDLYKSLSKKKKIESTLKTSTGKLKTIMDYIAKQELANKINDSIKQDSIMQTVKADTGLSNNTSTQQVTNTSDNTTVANSNSTLQTTNNSGEKKYYIIAGSYTSEEAAQTAVNNLKAQGFASEIAGQNAYGNIRICYNSFFNKEDALKELERIKSSVQADAWMLEK
ncbi:MAG: SPOR domain-containing protein [Bacteroidota bacterium]